MHRRRWLRHGGENVAVDAEEFDVYDPCLGCALGVSVCVRNYHRRPRPALLLFPFESNGYRLSKCHSGQIYFSVNSGRSAIDQK